jgi:Fe-S cluster assembly protein SufD
MLEDGAEIYAKPELEIYADDVQCAHGNTIGALDDAALFYMRTRGIPEVQAQAMLTEAFLLEAVPDDIPARDTIEARIKAWLGATP